MGVSLAITISLAFAHRAGSRRRVWVAAAVLTGLLIALGLIDLLRESPRETHLATVIVGASLPVLGAIGMIRGTRRVRPWLRWTLVFAGTVVLLFSALLIGATILPRFLPF